MDLEKRVLVILLVYVHSRDFQVLEPNTKLECSSLPQNAIRTKNTPCHQPSRIVIAGFELELQLFEMSRILNPLFLSYWKRSLGE